MIIGLVFSVWELGSWGLVRSLVGTGVAVTVLLGPFALGGVSGGDVKMMGGAGALLGPTLTLSALLVGFVFGGVIMTVQLARLGRLRETIAAATNMIAGAISQRSLTPLRVPASDPVAVSLPYSVSLGLGIIVVLGWGEAGRFWSGM